MYKERGEDKHLFTFSPACWGIRIAWEKGLGDEGVL